MDAAAANTADLATLARDNASLRGENKALRYQLDWFKRQLFGLGKRETLDRAQPLIALDPRRPRPRARSRPSPTSARRARAPRSSRRPRPSRTCP